MNYYALIPLTGLLITVFIWTYIFAQPRKGAIRFAYLLFSGFLCIWLALNFLLWLPMEKPLLDVFMRFYPMIWLPMGLLFYNFILVFLEKKKDPFYYLLLSLTLIAGSLNLTTDSIVKGYHLLYWGPSHYPGEYYLPAVFILITLPIIYGSILVFNKVRKVTNPRIRQQYWFILWGVGITLFLGIISELLPIYVKNSQNLVPLGSFSTVILSVFIFFAVIKYRFLAFSIEDVAEELFARVQDGVVIVDSNERLLRMNPGAKAILHIHGDDTLRPISSFFTNYSFDDDYSNFITQLSPKHGGGFVAVSQSNLEYGGQVHGKILVLRDITENIQLQDKLQKHSDHLEELVKERTQEIEAAHARLRASEERYRVLIENNFGLVFEIQDGFIVDFGPNCLGILGYEPDELIGHHGSEFVHPEDVHPLKERYQQLIQGKNTRTMTYRFRHKNGEWRWIESIGRHYDSPNRNGCVLYIARDVTENKRLEEEMIKANKLQSVGVLAGGIAHDFNNILGTIWGRISLALTYLEPGEMPFAILSQTEKGFDRAKDLTQQLLTFAKGGAPIKRPLSIVGLLQDAAAFALRGSNVVYRLTATEDIWPVEVDEGQMNQVFSNLIINAEQAMPLGGVIEITPENITVTSPSDLPLEEGRYVRIAVKDTGHGIPTEYLPKLFDPYFTTKTTGSGLGLTTAYSIVKRHGGHIGVVSQPGKGATFTIYLPASETPLISELPSKAISLSGEGKILVMDDEVELCSFLDQALTEHGYEVTIAYHGAEAIRLVKDSLADGEPYDLIIMDLTVPGGMGGKETMLALRQWDPDVKVIVSSGYSEDIVMGDYRKYGFSGVLPKPYSIQALLTLVHQILNEELSTDGEEEV